MPQFEYQALNAQSQVVSGIAQATDRVAVISTLTKQGLRPTSVHAVGTNKRSLRIPFLKQKVKSAELVIFTRQLSTMVSAGVPLLRALTTLQAQSSKAFQDVLAVIIKEVQAGGSLADALAKHPKVFSDVYVNMVRAGEAAGIVDDILKRLAAQVEKNASMKKKIKSASTYPVVLLVLTTGAFFGLMIFVIPTIGKILKDLGGPGAELPVMTQAMLAFSDFIISRWYLVFGVIFGLIFGIRWWLKTPQGKLMFHTFILKVPVLKVVIRKIAVARFTRTFAALIGAGVSVVESLRVTGRALGNELYIREIERATEEVINGKQLSQAMEGSKLFPAIVAQMMAVGEETGQTDVVLLKIADFYEEEVDATNESLSSILEPVMIVIMGAMVGLIAANVMGPIASLSQNIQ